ncbi:MAG: thiamine phosphate synthase [Myxococcota bacterium]|nr:thiamine phosphate synthase [Myxococcota bacterium]
MIHKGQSPLESRAAGIHVLADDDPRWSADPVQQAAAACQGGAQVVQLRSKFATDRQTLEWARAIRALTREAGVHFVVNDRFDLALAAEADGVHLGQDDLPPARIPVEALARLEVGYSTHDLAQAKSAGAMKELDYVAFGPVYGTKSKDSPYSPRGIEALAEISRAVAPLPLVAIGGIHAGNLRDVLRAGAAGMAVISAVAATPNPAEATRELRRIFDESLDAFGAGELS